MTPKSPNEKKEKKKLFYQAISLLISLISQPQAFGFIGVNTEDKLHKETHEDYVTILETAFREDKTDENIKNLGQLADYYPQIMEFLTRKLLKKVNNIIKL